jgi:hypothetical protein
MDKNTKFRVSVGSSAAESVDSHLMDIATTEEIKPVGRLVRLQYKGEDHFGILKQVDPDTLSLCTST